MPRAALAAMLIIACAGLPVSAQEETATQPATQPSPDDTISTTLPKIEDIQANLKAVDAATSLSDSDKAEIKSNYQKAIDWLRQAENWRRQAAERAQLRQEAPAKTKAITDRTTGAETRPAAADTLPDLEGMDFKAMTDSLAEAETREEEAKARVQRLTAEASNLTQRKIDIPKDLVKANEELSNVEKQIGPPRRPARPPRSRHHERPPCKRSARPSISRSPSTRRNFRVPMRWATS
jgi:chromosome segregation ATPase